MAIFCILFEFLFLLIGRIFFIISPDNEKEQIILFLFFKMIIYIYIYGLIVFINVKDNTEIITALNIHIWLNF